MSSPNITTRPREPNDIPRLTEILTEVHKLTKYPVDGPSSFAARFSSVTTLISIVALYDGQLAGHAELLDASGLHHVAVESLVREAPLDHYVALSTLFVDPKFRGKGIGAQLVEELIEWGRKEGKKLVLVVLEKDDAAIRMYERMEWKRDVEYFYESIQGMKYKAFLYRESGSYVRRYLSTSA